MERYKIATLKAKQTSNTNELIVNVFEYDDEGGSVAYFRAQRAANDKDVPELSTGARYAQFDKLSDALAFAAQEIGGRLEGNY